MREDTVRRSGAGSAQRRVGDKIHGQEGLEVCEGLGLGEIGEDLSQVMIGLKPIGLGGLDQGVQVGRGLGTGHGVMEIPILPVMQSFA